MQESQLPIHDMAKRHSGLTQDVAASLTEGARVCLDRHHQPPTTFLIRESEKQMGAVVEWEPTDARTRYAWANEIDTTEAGACACVLAAVELADGLVAVRRAETGSGADYYIAFPGTSADDLEDCVRLEVSGVDRGQPTTLTRRLKAKLDQAAAGRSNLPAVVGVVGFQARLILLSRLEES